MKFFILFAILAQMSAAQAQDFKVLLTSFDPFGGSPNNNTQAIVAELSQMAAQLGASVVIQSCNLPVVYDAGAEAAMDCVRKGTPDLVISMGEAGCFLQIETAATNLDKSPGFPDNSGLIRNGTAIVAGGPLRSGFNYPVQSMYCALGATSPPVKVSIDPGAFVCNNTAYHLSQDLKAKGIPFTFIHVPNTRCVPAQVDPKKNAQVLAKMISTAIATLRGPGPKGTMPTTRAEALTFLQQQSAHGVPPCAVSFAQKVLSAYPSP